MDTASTRKTMTALIRGGIGNQLFCYAFARNLSLMHGYRLFLDLRTGFARDFTYRRSPCLHHFAIGVPSASARLRMEPLGRFRRKAALWLTERGFPLTTRYILEQQRAFDARYLDEPRASHVYLDGYWQCERYFKEHETVIRSDLAFKGLMPSESNRTMRDQIDPARDVMLHYRCFHNPADRTVVHAELREYYRKAIEYTGTVIREPRYVVFSDRPESVRDQLGPLLPTGYVIVHINDEASAIYDLWLQTHFRHFIIANSTFSWWGAWLSNRPGKVVVAPSVRTSGVSDWGFDGLIPATWIIL